MQKLSPISKLYKGQLLLPQTHKSPHPHPPHRNISMFRLRKVFHKDSPANHPQISPTKPVYRGTKPLTVSDIHSHSPVEKRPMGDIDYYYDELGTPRSHPRRRDSEETNVLDILDSFPAPPPLKAVVSGAHKDGPRFYFPHDDLFDDLLPPPPDKVLTMVKERERTLTHQARLEQQATPAPVVPPHYGVLSHRRPLYATSHANLSTRSLGANACLKAGPTAQGAVVHQPSGHSSVSQRAYTVTSASRPSPRPEGRRKQLYPIPEGERQRLRSAPTQISSYDLSMAN
ncbi:hypothetical protein B0H14DRAFT_1253902 [Mycena olivaceomarginata]|nr:hypothetical protein B0H14DRAFT_1253902 [Mycena olivaceomarginata]